MKFMHLGEFEIFLSERKLVLEDKRCFHIHWVRRFPGAEFAASSMHLSTAKYAKLIRADWLESGDKLALQEK
jgi:hypothetical protein